MKSGAGATFMISYSLGRSGGMPPENLFWYFRALRQLLVQSEAKFFIELLNICFIDNTDLVLWLTYCTKKSFFI